MYNLSTPELLARIDALLVQAIGLGIDADRMRADALYARDVLLVCDALDGSEGPALAQRFRTLRGLQTAARSEEASTRKPGLRADRRRGPRQDHRRNRGKGHAPNGRERRRGPRRRVDGDHAKAAPAEPEPTAAASGSRIFSSVFGVTSQPPDADLRPEQTEAAPQRRWFRRRAGPRDER